MNERLQVFPVNKVYDSAKGKWRKAPAIPKGEDWHTYQAEPSRLEHSANLGVVIPNGMVVIDLDFYKGVTTEIIDKIMGVECDWDGALLQKTISGGAHFAFRLPAGAHAPQGENLLNIEGFDTRASGKGWICTGEGYTDETIFGMPDALGLQDFPMLPTEVVEKLNEGFKPSSGGEVGDLESALASQPLDDLTLDTMWSYLEKLPPDDLESYSPWLKAGMAIYHQTSGSDDGFELWVKWSKKSSHYNIDECRKKWHSFGKNEHINKPTRFDYVIGRAGGRAAITVDVAASWVEKAAEVATDADYEALKAKLKRVGLAVLPKDQRQRIAQVLFDAYGKGLGITKGAIVEAITPPKGKPTGLMTSADAPEWVRDWVYVEETCEFASVPLNYAIRREAFNAKFDRLGDVIEAEKPASAYALIDCKIPTVVNRIFWPAGDTILDLDGKLMLNSYRDQGATPCDYLDDEARVMIDRMLAHIEFTLDDERERTILLDWLSFVCQNHGQRVNWALLLQGAQGTGKSYFANVLQAVMGSLVTNLEAAALAGRFTGWAHGSLVIVVEEVRISGQNSYEAMDRIKPFISNSTVQIEEKGRDHRTVPNFTSYLMLTNHKDALPLAEGDRRYCVMYSRVQSEEQLFRELGGEKGAEVYFDQLFDDLRERPDAFAHYFKNRKISADFKPRGRAPDTTSKRKMVALGVSPERSQIEDAVDMFECEVINKDVLDVTWLNNLCERDGVELPKTRTMSRILSEMGYEKADPSRVKIVRTGKLHYVWTRSDYADKLHARKTVKDFHDEGAIPF
jgi:hypothetical protein